MAPLRVCPPPAIALLVVLVFARVGLCSGRAAPLAPLFALPGTAALEGPRNGSAAVLPRAYPAAAPLSLALPPPNLSAFAGPQSAPRTFDAALVPLSGVAKLLGWLPVLSTTSRLRLALSLLALHGAVSFGAAAATTCGVGSFTGNQGAFMCSSPSGCCPCPVSASIHWSYFSFCPGDNKLYDCPSVRVKAHSEDCQPRPPLLTPPPPPLRVCSRENSAARAQGFVAPWAPGAPRAQLCAMPALRGRLATCGGPPIPLRARVAPRAPSARAATQSALPARQARLAPRTPHPAPLRQPPAQQGPTQMAPPPLAPRAQPALSARAAAQLVLPARAALQAAARAPRAAPRAPLAQRGRSASRARNPAAPAPRARLAPPHLIPAATALWACTASQTRPPAPSRRRPAPLGPPLSPPLPARSSV